MCKEIKKKREKERNRFTEKEGKKREKKNTPHKEERQTGDLSQDLVRNVRERERYGRVFEVK